MSPETYYERGCDLPSASLITRMTAHRTDGWPRGLRNAHPRISHETYSQEQQASQFHIISINYSIDKIHT